MSLLGMFHLSCIYLSKLTQNDLKNFTWRCSYCIDEFLLLESENAKLKQKIIDLEKKISDDSELSQKLNDLTVKVDTVNSSLGNVMSALTPSYADMAKSERKKKTC